MSGRESRTISVLEGDWERWGDLAWKARVSRSEYIRRAVKAYDEQAPRSPHSLATRTVSQARQSGTYAAASLVDGAGLEEGVRRREAEAALSAAASGVPGTLVVEMPPPFRGTFTKAQQVRKKP